VKAKKKKDKEAMLVAEKTKRVVVKAGKKPEGSAAKTKAANASLSVGEEVPQNSLVTLSSGIRKRDATFARLSLSRLQLGISSPRVYSFSIFHK
jgi:hypothetical protein